MKFAVTGQEKGDHMGRFDCIYNIKEVTCLIRPLFLCPKGDLFKASLIVYIIYKTV